MHHGPMLPRASFRDLAVSAIGCVFRCAESKEV
jgi:hypothetical protein